MGCGKSTLGRKWAKEIGWDFIDLDSYIEEKEGKSISKVFEDCGESYFRRIETKSLKDIIKLNSCIVSCGGGTPCFNNNMEMLTLAGCSIYMKVSVKILFDRLKSEKSKRPLIANMTDDQMLEFINYKLKQRSLFYEQSSHIYNNVLESEEMFVKRLNSFLI
jgi:shikimate kinase